MPRRDRCTWSVWRRGRERLLIRQGMERGLASRLAAAESSQRAAAAVLLGEKVAMAGELAISTDGRIIIKFWPDYRS